MEEELSQDAGKFAEFVDPLVEVELSIEVMEDFPDSRSVSCR